MPWFSIGAYKDALAAALELRAGLSGVTVYAAEVHTGDLKREAVVLGNWTHTFEQITQGPAGTYEEVYSIECQIVSERPDSTTAARDRALAIMEEVQAELDEDHTVGGIVWDSQYSGHTGEETYDAEGGRRCVLQFTIEMKAQPS
jgi:hypothetical protein